MKYQVRNSNEGYIVDAYYEGKWYPIRNFGNRQGDARLFAYSDAENLSEMQLRMLIKNFKKDRIYIRINSRTFKAIDNKKTDPKSEPVLYSG